MNKALFQKPQKALAYRAVVANRELIENALIELERVDTLNDSFLEGCASMLEEEKLQSVSDDSIDLSSSSCSLDS